MLFGLNSKVQIYPYYIQYNYTKQRTMYSILYFHTSDQTKDPLSTMSHVEQKLSYEKVRKPFSVYYLTVHLTV